jgi:hypothetical protein
MAVFRIGVEFMALFLPRKFFPAALNPLIAESAAWH